MCKRCLIQLFKVLGEGTALGRRTLELTFLVANLQSGLGLLRRKGTNNLIHSGEPAFLGGLLCSGSLVQKKRTAAVTTLLCNLPLKSSDFCRCAPKRPQGRQMLSVATSKANEARPLRPKPPKTRNRFRLGLLCCLLPGVAWSTCKPGCA